MKICDLVILPMVFRFGVLIGGFISGVSLLEVLSKAFAAKMLKPPTKSSTVSWPVYKKVFKIIRSLQFNLVESSQVQDVKDVVDQCQNVYR